jgi:[acyl-carrier-protein] S-malonyltransferase
MKACLMFSGQGSQYLGMGQDLYNNFDEVKDLFKRASKVLGYDIASVMFEDEEKLNDTLYTQVAMFVLYASGLKVLEAKGFDFDTSIGLSLGEYGAMYHNGVFDFETGVALLQHRGAYMSDAAAKVDGKMSAILGMDAADLLDIIESVDSYVKIANYNTYGQLVISGEESGVLKVNELALEKGAKRAILLNTSGPFHTDLMSEASLNFKSYLDTVDLSTPQKRLLVNTSGSDVEGDIKEVMVNQIVSSVKFYQMIEVLLEDGYDTFIEIGPKKTLLGFVKKINRKVTMLQVEDLTSLEKTVEKLEENNG